MATVWMVNEWGADGDLHAVVRRLRIFANQAGVNLSVKESRAAELLSLQVEESDVVVVCQNCEPGASALPQGTPGWLTRESSVLPVIRTASDAKGLRWYLKERNALIRGQDPAFASTLFDEIATLAVQMRPAKKVFISYQRAATLAAAHHLADELQAMGFDTFLDERSIPHGADVDAEIGYRLNDVDLVILLVTSTLRSSTWVLKEVEFAHNAKLGIIAVDCDSNGAPAALFSYLHDDEVLTLTHAIIDPADSFSAVDLPRVLERVRQERVGSIARRVADLVPAAADQLGLWHPGRVRAGERLGEIEVEGISGLTQVVPFRPTPELLWQLRRRHQGKRIDVIHPESVPLDPRVVALEWLLLPVELEVEVHRAKKMWV